MQSIDDTKPRPWRGRLNCRFVKTDKHGRELEETSVSIGATASHAYWTEDLQHAGKDMLILYLEKGVKLEIPVEAYISHQHVKGK